MVPTEQTSASARQVAAAAGDLATNAETLNGLVAEFQARELKPPGTPCRRVLLAKPRAVTQVLARAADDSHAGAHRPQEESLPTYPVTFEMDYAERRSRLTTFFRGLLAMPHFLFAGVFTLAFFVVYVIAWLALMFTGRWPAGLYQFACGYLRYSARLVAYLNFGVDQYPPFSGAVDDSYPVRVAIAPALARYSRVKVFFRGIYAILAILIRYALGIVLACAALLSWFAIMFTGRQPASLQNALNFSLSYTIRADALIFLITEKHPPLGDGGLALPQPTV